MSEREYKRVTQQLKPFITLFIVVVGSAFLASCGGGDATSSDSNAVVNSGDGSMKHVLAVSGGVVPIGWIGRKPTADFNKAPNTDFRDYTINSRAIRGNISNDMIVKGEIRIRLSSATELSSMQVWAAQRKYKIVYIGTPVLNNLTILTTAETEADLLLVMQEIRNLPYVVSVGANSILSTNSSTLFSDPSWGEDRQSWNMKSIKLEEATLLLGAAASNIVSIGVIDSGFAAAHEDLVFANIDIPLSSTANKKDHGTHVSGIIAATQNNIGITGIAKSTALYASASKTSDDVWNAISGQMLTRKVKVINLSMGNSLCSEEPFYRPECVEAAQYLPTAATQEAVYKNNIDVLHDIVDVLDRYDAIGGSPLFIQSSGNDGQYLFGQKDTLFPPASGLAITAEYNGLFSGAIGTIHPKTVTDAELLQKVVSHILIVGAYYSDGGVNKISPYTSLPRLTNPNKSIADSLILAPGGYGAGKIYSTVATNRSAYDYKTGTSMAAPHVTGVAGLVAKANDNLTAPEIRDVILKSADTNLGTPFKDRKADDGSDGYRYLNAEAAVKEAIRRKVEVNCGSITSPQVVGQQGPLYSAIVGQATAFTAIATAKPGYKFSTYQWKTSEGVDAGGPTPDMTFRFNAVGTVSVTVTPVLADGTACTGSAATSAVTVANVPIAILQDEFNGTSVDTTKWNIDGWDASHIGPVSVAGGLAQFGAWGRINTKNKVTFSGQRIVIEARMAGQGGSRDTSILFADAESGEYIYSGDTNYSGWGFFVDATGAYRLLDAGSGPAALGGSTNQFMEYRWTLEGNKITIERGPTLTNITQTATRTLGRSIVGRSFYLSIGTASPAYSPGTWDWVRVYAGTGILNPANGHRYEVISCTTWTTCRDAATAKGGALVTIRSEVEQNWIIGTFGSTKKKNFGFWIGLTDDGTEGVWRWASGEPVGTYRPWLNNQPSNSFGGENFVHLWWYGLDLVPQVPSIIGWNDVTNTGSGADISQAIVEYSN